MSSFSSLDKLKRKKKRREERIQRFNQWRDQTKKNPSCHNCFWLDKPWGQTPCKSCSRFDSKRRVDKYKRTE